MQRWSRLALLLGLQASVCLAVVAGCSDEPDPQSQPLSYVGRDACASCHAAEATSWTGSHHDLAMQPAEELTVLAPFEGEEFAHYDLTSRFFRKGDEFIVETEGADGALAEFVVKYTFGVEPLQQYMVEFPDGRVQVLGLCWDTRPRSDGGQRWFFLYPGERIPPGDPLHWTGPYQNWNFMCAECHSTDLKKNYDPATDTFSTAWSEIDVSCESCHGPASRHVAWAERGRKADLPHSGFTTSLRDSDGGTWIFEGDAPNAIRKPERTVDNEFDVCARCHARRSQLREGAWQGTHLLDSHRPSLLDPSLYHVDGQIRDEVYVYGSFLQSKMFQKGVTCSDCHDPHSLELKKPGNELCGQCHRAAVYDTDAHHKHATAPTGNQCVECHMPATTYMVVDPRRDHSFRVPRPDLTLSLGTPNACNQCHADRDAAWAAETVEEWFGERAPHYGEALAAAQNDEPDALPRLLALVIDTEAPSIARATAIEWLAAYPAPELLPVLQRLTGETDPLIRRAAVSALANYPPDQRFSVLFALLDDPVLGVRIEAARLLTGLPEEQLPEDVLAKVRAGWQEWQDSQATTADRAESHHNLGSFYAERRDFEAAEVEYQRALALNPHFSPAAVNLSDLYRVLGRDEDGDAVLRAQLERDPNNGDLHHALGLSLVRRSLMNEALQALSRGAALAPGNPRYAYVYAVALESNDQKELAFQTLRDALKRHPRNPDLLLAAAEYGHDLGHVVEAERYARELLELVPEHPAAKAILEGTGD